MNARKRPKDIIEAIETIAGEGGQFEPVDENYYQAFLDLTQPQIERLAIAIMLDQEKEVRRLAGGRINPAAIDRVAKMVRGVCTAIGIGVARFDAFGRLGFVARLGPDPSLEMDDAMHQKFEAIQPVIRNIVRRTLPWLLSRDVSQGELAL